MSRAQRVPKMGVRVPGRPASAPAVRWLVLSALLLPLILAACTGGESTTLVQPTLRTDRVGPLSFQYPASWTARRYSETSSFRTYLVYLSNQPMVTPCRTTSSGPAGATFSTECGLAVRHLHSGGVLAWWSENGFAGWSFDKNAKGEALTVGGYRAKLLVEPGCHGIGGEESMTTVVEYPTEPSYNWYEFDACVRGPGIDQVETQVRALLASTRFAKSG
jgi:hypothetical protein